MPNLKLEKLQGVKIMNFNVVMEFVYLDVNDVMVSATARITLMNSVTVNTMTENHIGNYISERRVVKKFRTWSI